MLNKTSNIVKLRIRILPVFMCLVFEPMSAPVSAKCRIKRELLIVAKLSLACKRFAPTLQDDRALTFERPVCFG